MAMKAHVDREPEAVVAELLEESAWQQLCTDATRATRRGRGKAYHCWCTECGWGMHPKRISMTGTRFFAHNRGNTFNCSLHNGETEEHRRLKIDIYRAIRSVPGWSAGIEEATDALDPVTGKPARVDVVAYDDKRPEGRSAKLGFEVQLSAMTDGQAMDRQEIRERWMERCTWVTKSHPSWVDRLPWYQVDCLEGSRNYLVIDGVVTEGPVEEGGTAFFKVDPFPAQVMVRRMLQRSTYWAEGEGWIMQDAVGHRRHRRGEPIRGRRELLEDHCHREITVADFALGWSEAEWMRYAAGAHERRRRGTFLTDLDRAAFVRYPFLDMEDLPLYQSPALPYDRMSMTLPCIWCGQVVIVTWDSGQPLHHRCRWERERGDRC